MATKKSTKIKPKAKPVKAVSLKKMQFVLPEIADVTAAKDVYSNLSDLLMSNAKEVVVDASKVEKITTPVFQILVSASHTAKLKLKVVAMSDAFTAVGNELGFAYLIKQWEE